MSSAPGAPPRTACRAMPARSASRARASGNVTPSICMTKLNTSPPMSQTQHLNDCRSGFTWRLGRVSLCQGHSPTYVAALAAKLNISPHKLDDIDRLLYALFHVERRTSRHRQLLCGKMRKIHFTSEKPQPGKSVCRSATLPGSACWRRHLDAGRTVPANHKARPLAFPRSAATVSSVRQSILSRVRLIIAPGGTGSRTRFLPRHMRCQALETTPKSCHRRNSSGRWHGWSVKLRRLLRME